MLDKFGRNIEYMRVSVTEKCNLRCRYCMPNGADCPSSADTLSREELLRICRAAVSLGVTKFKITGGEPLMRRDCVEIIKDIKSMPGVEEVTLTTNALNLAPVLPALHSAGIDGINISLDSLNPERYARITGAAPAMLSCALDAVDASCNLGIKTKVNCVLLNETSDEVTALASLAKDKSLDVRFIELMPIGLGARMERADPDTALAEIQEMWPQIRPTGEKRGNGPAHYYEIPGFKGKIGFIDAVSHRFCSDCNRIRLTSTGQLKPCLCYGESTDLKAVISSGADDEALCAALSHAIYSKPRAHCFDTRESITEKHMMSQIGG